MPEKPTPTPEDIAKKSVPSRMEKESKEFVESLSEKEYEETKTRHRSVAQLERRGAEVKEGRLVVTPEQIENARKMMDKELAQRGWGEKVGVAARNFFRSAEKSADRVVGRLSPLWERGRQVWGKVREANYGKFVSLVIDLPSNFSQEMFEIAAKQAEKLEAKRNERVAAFRESMKELQEESAQRRAEWQEKRGAEMVRVMEEGRRRYNLLAAKWGRDADDLGSAFQEKKDADYSVFGEWLKEQGDRLAGELQVFTEAEEEVLRENTEKLEQKFEKKALPVYERLGEALEVRDRWSSRARRTREISDRLKGFIGIEVQR